MKYITYGFLKIQIKPTKSTWTENAVSSHCNRDSEMKAKCANMAQERDPVRILSAGEDTPGIRPLVTSVSSKHDTVPGVF